MMMRLKNHVDRLVWGDMLTQRGPAGRFAAGVLRHFYALVRDMFGGQLMMRAMSLVYTTLLSVVPLLAFSFSVLKGFGIHNELQPLLFQLLEPLGPQGAEITRQVIELVDNVKGGVLGGISLAFFIYTAVSMVQKVEESFNYVWYVSKRRNFARRLTEYMVVMLVAPVIIVVALSIIGALESNAVVQYIQNVGWLQPVLSRLTPYLLVTGVFTFLYIYVPNTRVRFSSALVGGVAAGVAWASLGVFFATFVVYSTRIQVVYSGFAVAILTLIWLYLNWIVLLVGAQLAFYHQNPAFLRIGRREPRLSGSMQERLALNIMYLVGQAFREGNAAVTIRSLAEKLRVPSLTLMPIATGLETEGLLVTTEQEFLVPGREMSRIRLGEVLATVREKGETGWYRNPKWTPAIGSLGEQIDAAVGGTIGELTLAELLDRDQGSSAE
jgi:membrane protein